MNGELWVSYPDQFDYSVCSSSHCDECDYNFRETPIWIAEQILQLVEWWRWRLGPSRSRFLAACFSTIPFLGSNYQKVNSQCQTRAYTDQHIQYENPSSFGISASSNFAPGPFACMGAANQLDVDIVKDQLVESQAPTLLSEFFPSIIIAVIASFQ